MQLEATIRNTQSEPAAKIRAAGKVPAELYGQGIVNEHISVSAKDFAKIFKEAGTATVLDLLIDGRKHSVLIHEVSRDRISGQAEHVDFYQIRLDRKIRVHVPLAFVGESPAVKSGCLLNKAVTEIEVEALPGKLPHEIEVDISVLAAADESVYIRDLKVPAGVEIISEPDMAIASVALPEEEPVAAEPADVSDIKVETEEKKAARATEEKTAGE